MRQAIWVFVVLTLTVSGKMDGQHIVGSRQLNERIVLGDLDDAFAEYDSLAAYNRRAAATDSARHGAYRYVYLREVALFMFDKVQVAVLQHDHDGAERLFTEAADFVASHFATNGTHAVGADINAVAEVTRGFIAEKNGDQSTAIRAYESAGSEAAHGRLALLALEQGRTDEAKAWAQRDTLNPTSELVLGRIAELSKSIQRARLWYEKASLRVGKMMGLGADAELMPIYFFESPAIELARARLKR